MTGTPVFMAGASGPVNGALGDAFGNTLYVDTVNGKATASGRSQKQAMSTMAAAFAKINSNGTIFVSGHVAEQITAPLGVYGVKIIGLVGGRNRDTTNNGVVTAGNGVSWVTAGVASTPLLTLREQGWEVHHIQFVPGTGIPGIRLRREENATYPDSSHAIIAHCKFVSDTGTAIESYDGAHHILIEDCEFSAASTALPIGITNTANLGIANPLRWIIRNNRFTHVTKAIVLAANECVIEGNIFDLPFAGSNATIDLTGGNGYNMVLQNQFADTAANMVTGKGYVSAAATDIWRNFSTTTAAYTVGVPTA